MWSITTEFVCNFPAPLPVVPLYVGSSGCSSPAAGTVFSGYKSAKQLNRFCYSINSRDNNCVKIKEGRTSGFAQVTSQASCGPRGEEGQRHLYILERFLRLQQELGWDLRVAYVAGSNNKRPGTRVNLQRSLDVPTRLAAVLGIWAHCCSALCRYDQSGPKQTVEGWFHHV